MIWSALPDKAIDSAVKDFSKRLQAHVSANTHHFKPKKNKTIYVTDTDSYL